MSGGKIHLPERILRYGVAGLSVSVSYTLLVVFLVHEFPTLGPTANAAIAFLIVQPLGLLLHGTITYPETGMARGHLPRIGVRFIVTNAVGFMISIGGMGLVTLQLHESYLWGIALSWAIIPAINFLIYLFWVFKPSLRSDGEKPI
jgi:hypothetical protein